ncbi:MAG TPA: sugar transferase [Smithella sp.]|nr:sugar transferase [Smithella sp.]
MIDIKASVEGKYPFYSKSQLHHMLGIERRRTERSKNPFLLLLLDISGLIATARKKEILEKIKSALSSSLRETDMMGWFTDNKIIGIICPEISLVNSNSIEGIINKIHGRFCEKLNPELVKIINISFHIYPETSGDILINGPFNITLYPDLTKRTLGKKISMSVKNFIDIVGSAIALLIFSPLFLIIALLIKATSSGPVFFKQERIGLNGKPFLLLKFRSMYANVDSKKHKESHITKVGHFLRKTGMDELPQLINVLKGDMSMVGPRPPICYEYEHYEIWHRRRLLFCKPGITGLWQIMGRGGTTFDEMVRLDLKYINEWSLLLDLKILLMTPVAVMSG